MEFNSLGYLKHIVNLDKNLVVSFIEQGIYWYLHAIRAVRTGDPWIGMYDYVLRMEFEVEDEKARDEFIRQAKAATCIAELPLMSEGIKDTIDRGMEWGREDGATE